MDRLIAAAAVTAAGLAAIAAGWIVAGIVWPFIAHFWGES